MRWILFTCRFNAKSATKYNLVQVANHDLLLHMIDHVQFIYISTEYIERQVYTKDITIDGSIRTACL